MATLKGIWVFNDNPSLSFSSRYFDVNFTSNNSSYTQIGFDEDSATYGVISLYYNSQEAYTYGSYMDGWINAAYKTVDFGTTEQTVDDTFYTWLTANATQQASEETSAVTVEYDGEVVATIPSGNKATIPIADKKMKTDIVITVPKAEGGTDSPLPTEVSTEAEMTALLESGEVGGVYKYTGTTGTYENGALYVLENSTGTFTILSSSGTEKGTYTFDIGMTFTDFVASDYNTNNVFKIVDSTNVFYTMIRIVGVTPSSIISERNYSLAASGGA